MPCTRRRTSSGSTEGLVIRNSVHGADSVDRTPAFYTQISRQFGKVRPYFRYQFLDVPDTDAYFADVGRMRGPSLGLRFDFSQFSAFKFQYDRADRGDTGANAVTTQLSFVF